MADQGKERPREPDFEYRRWLVAAEQKSQEDYDKTVLSLSGGALGVSFIFVKDVVGAASVQYPSFLLAAWLLWAVSSFSVLLSFFMSRLALREAIRQCDVGEIFESRPGGFYSRVTEFLNVIGAAAFICGVCFMAAFVYLNLSAREIPHGNKDTQQAVTAIANSAQALHSVVAKR